MFAGHVIIFKSTDKTEIEKSDDMQSRAGGFRIGKTKTEYIATIGVRSTTSGYVVKVE